MNKQDKAFGIALLVALALSTVIAVISKKVGDDVGYARLENPATYHG